MITPLLWPMFIGASLAARPFLDEPDTGFDEFFADLGVGEFPALEKLVGLPDFQSAARMVLPVENYTYYRSGAAGEWSYRRNLEIWYQYLFRPRTMIDTTRMEETLPTTILGHNFSSPFFIAPGEYGHQDAEKGLVEAAAAEDILYIPSNYASLSMTEIAALKKEGQVTFQQCYLTGDLDAAQNLIDRAEKAGAEALIWTVDVPVTGNRQRDIRYDSGSRERDFRLSTWELYDKLQTMTDLPIVPKGIQRVEEARLAVEHGAPAIYLSNHGGRQVDGVRTAFEVAMEIRNEAPEIFSQIEVYADGGVRYGADVIKMLALGVRAVGVARPFMFANVYGTEGVTRAIQLLKGEIIADGGNVGVTDLHNVDFNVVDWRPAYGIHG
ncbi:FMN-dependent alpha-hydroxy acid dehydrogenase [Xylariomycetidae sp. FL2044]|nr:FMN-dependent alpha-hydroxy acid dehydrogenase [Xylariomycetidae sp. FL2044]